MPHGSTETESNFKLGLYTIPVTHQDAHLGIVRSIKKNQYLKLY